MFWVCYVGIVVVNLFSWCSDVLDVVIIVSIDNGNWWIVWFYIRVMVVNLDVN